MIGGNGTLWGIDLGGTKIEGVVLDADNPSRILCRPRLPTERTKGYDHILDQIRKIVEAMERESGLQRPPVIGIGTPGSLSPKSGQLRNSNTTALNGRCLKSDLQKKLGVSLQMENDANCFALAEARLGSARGRSVVFGVILGTGVGAGIVVNGRTLNGLQSIAGEWGHNTLEPDGAECYCGQRGCVETVISGYALENEFRERTGRALTLPEIVREAAHDPQAAMTIDRLVQGFSRAIAVVINILDPECIVIGGGVGNIDALYTQYARECVAKKVFNDYFETPILRPLLGDSAGALGAALLTASQGEPASNLAAHHSASS